MQISCQRRSRLRVGSDQAALCGHARGTAYQIRGLDAGIQPCLLFPLSGSEGKRLREGSAADTVTSRCPSIFTVIFTHERAFSQKTRANSRLKGFPPRLPTRAPARIPTRIATRIPTHAPARKASAGKPSARRKTNCRPDKDKASRVCYRRLNHPLMDGLTLPERCPWRGHDVLVGECCAHGLVSGISPHINRARDPSG